MRRELGLEEDELVILFVGRNHREKGFDLLLDALSRLPASDRRIVALLVGVGTEAAGIPRSAAGRIVALGERRDVADLMRAADALVLPSRSEGTPNAVIEAMASALTCVVTDVGDSADLVGGTGIVVATATAEDLTRGLQQLIAMPDADREVRGAAARERARTRHGLDTARSHYRRLWSEGAR
jgi:glycosyltransferase involved in cell wall biosynthesis